MHVDVTVGQLKLVYIRYAQAHPSGLHLPVGDVLWASLLDAFPCDVRSAMNIIKGLFIAIAITSSTVTPVLADDPDFITAMELVDACQGNASGFDTGWCLGYIHGFRRLDHPSDREPQS